MKALVLLFSILLGSSSAMGLSCASWQHASLPDCIELAQNVVTRWVVYNDTIRFNHTVRAAGVGFLALGISETGSMKGADMFVLQGPGPNWKLTDRYADGFVTPKEDSQQDVLMHGVYDLPSKGLLSVEFSRKLAPCDKQDLPIRKGEKLYLQYAYGPKFKYHGPNRGTQVVDLYPAAKVQAVAQPKKLPKSSKILNISISSFEIPAQETTYVYQFFKFPTDK